MDDMIRMKNTKFTAFEMKIDTLKQTLSKQVKEKESLLTDLNGFKTKFKQRESKSIDKEIVLENKNKELENIISQQIKPTLYDGNVLSKTHDVVIHMVDDEETLILVEESRLKMVEKQNDPIMKKEKINITPIDYSELNKLSEDFEEQLFLIENDLLLDKIISQEIRNIVLHSSIVICDSEKKNEDYVATSKGHCHQKLKETIHSLRENANPVKVKQDIYEIKTINIELEHSVAKLLFENEKLHKEKEHLKKTYKELYDSIKPTRVRAKEQCDALIVNLNSKSMENANLKTQIQEKVFANAALKTELRKLKEKKVINTVVSKPLATTIAPGMYELELEHLPPKVLKNVDAHIAYIKHSRDHADTLRDIVESARELSPLDSNLDSSCKYVQRIQEVLVYVKDTCPCFIKHSDKLVVVTSLNKDKKVRFADPSMLNANSKSVCAICNECLFDATRDKCVFDYVHDVNVLSKSKRAKRKNKKQIWKPTGKVYTEIGYKWKPTGRTFTIVRNKCPLTWFTSTKVVPLKETTIKSVLTPTQGIKVYSKRSKAPKSVGSSSKSKIIESRIFNISDPTQSGGSTISNVPCSSLIDCRLVTIRLLRMGYGYYQIGNVTISRVYYIEGLRHNLFSVGQFCDSNLEVAFRKHICFVHNLEGVDLLTGSRGTNLYRLSIGDTMNSSPICLLSKASKTKSWL
ncbi:hypothetical protein Tco_0922244 [Tanacetum coccineum]|uniref:Integrase, catalytic region, zinc finger, CCHC-type, peptidase aspartic, catalytic n=1 Tax=Tanacetum coccineum TaxID=301880 RepID=A0ABQ5CYT9_9ASTR